MKDDVGFLFFRSGIFFGTPPLQCFAVFQDLIDFFQVIAAIEQRSSTAKPTASASTPSLSPSSPPRATVSIPQAHVTSNSVHPIRGYTRTMIKTMTAQALVPHFGYCDEIVFDEVIKLRSAVKSSAAASGINFSYLPVVIKAVSLSLLRFPQLNAKLTQDMGSLEHFASHNIGADPFFFLL
jgi:pyruvate/2-oxoglutarate dehydrogenase complex dihydrolipoamide acyltransferase (E2) component